MLELDHVAVLGETLAEAVSHAESALGLPLSPGGAHPDFGTHNFLLGLENDLYLEAIAVDPSAPDPGRPRWFGLDGFTGPARLDKWVCRVPDLDAALKVLPMAGEAVAVTRGALSWKISVPRDGLLPFDGMFPALIEWVSPVPPGVSLAGAGIRLDRLTVAHPQADALQALLAPHLNVPLAEFEVEAKPALRGSFVTVSGSRVLQ
ncbi:polyphosphate kinase [Salipiger sp. CCB-MM3]|uniref:VOC family protein n=1 Tax=Salipiger sp. CCB-MM3 TaxID=1792508 RepID=UPI00080AA59E|nr:VOC family protein [Salipiger sp. CCB-MM3]ANT62080.1 polyphosphate kinase [Salipiger sp. CCB-MM3]